MQKRAELFGAFFCTYVIMIVYEAAMPKCKKCCHGVDFDGFGARWHID